MIKLAAGLALCAALSGCIAPSDCTALNLQRGTADCGHETFDGKGATVPTLSAVYAPISDLKTVTTTAHVTASGRIVIRSSNVSHK